MTQRHLDLLDAVLQTTRAVADRLGPDDLGLPTPCAELDVRGLLEHMIGWQQVTAACARDEEPAFADGSPTYTASANVAADLRRDSTQLVTSLRGRTTDTISMPYRGDTSVDVVHAELVAETVIHTWDLAAALGVPVAFDDAVLDAAEDGLSMLLGESFAAVGFRPPPARRSDALRVGAPARAQRPCAGGVGHGMTSRCAGRGGACQHRRHAWTSARPLRHD